MPSIFTFCREMASSLIRCATMALLLSAISVADEPNLDDPSAGQILDRMVRAYADCKTYRDTGVVKTVFIEANGTRTVEKPFTTAMVRPDRFRFEYKETGNQRNRYIIWSSGKDVKTWWGIKPGIKMSDSLELALAGATGVSGGSAHTIPAMFLPDKVSGLKLTEITGAKRAEDGKLDNVECYRIEGKFLDSPYTLWIDKKLYLVRRIDEQQTFDGFRTEDTTTYDPVIDAEIEDKMLDFAPPVRK